MNSAIARRKEHHEYYSPFYSLPQRKTSAQIIREAKTALDYDSQTRPGLLSRVGVKTVHTRRPFTPREKERTLFGSNLADGLRERRPPSSFTLSPLNFDPSDVNNRMPSASIITRPMSRLLPLLSCTGNDINAPSLAAKRRVHRYQFRTTLSLCDLPEEVEESDDRKPLPKKSTGIMYRSSTYNAFQNLQNQNTEDEFKDIKKAEIIPTINGLNNHPAIERKLHKQMENSILTDKDENEKSTKSFEEEPKVDQTSYYEEKVAPMLDEITRALECGVDDGVLAEILQKLYNCLEAGGLLGRHFQYRTQVLKTIFKLVDREQGYLLSVLARTMLALKVRGSNLTSVCKLVFKVTRHDVNDILFMEGNLLDLVLEAVACASPLEHSEACVYGYGALKFLTMNSHLVTRLLHRGVLELLVLHMKLIATQKEDCGTVPEQTGYALVQLTGTLRHVSSCEKAFKLLLVTGAVEQVCKLFIAFHEDPEVTVNIVRILSIISTQEDCCLAAASVNGMLAASVKALKFHANRPAVIVRLAYALGNMMAVSDEARWTLFNVESFPNVILSLMAEYIRRDREDDGVSDLDPLNTVSGTPEDVIIKLIRVLANMSVQPKVGSVLANSSTCLSMLVNLVNHKSVDECEELVLSALATLNNLTFYTRLQPPTDLHKELARNLCDILPMDHVDGLVEMIRVFGNLTHSKEVRNILLEKEVLEILIEMLDCDSRELVFVCAGVLVNMMSDTDKRLIFQKERGVLRMIDVLQYFGYGDWQLCCLVCQVLWNFCASTTNVLEVFNNKEAGKLTLVLEEFLDEDTYFKNPEILGIQDQSTRDVIYNLWEDFAAVATKLLDRIEENKSHGGIKEENGMEE